MSPSLTGQSLVEKFRSLPGELAFSRSELLSRSRAAATNDFDNNGVPNVIYRDSLFFRFADIGGPAGEEFLFEIPASIRNKSGFWAPYHVSGGKFADIIFATRPENSSPSGCTCVDVTHLVLDDPGGTAYVSFTLTNVIGFFDMDGDQLVDYLRFDEENRQIVVLGHPNPAGIASPLIPVSVRSNQLSGLQLKYESDVDARIPYLPNAFLSTSDYDLNGDDVPELVLTRRDTLDNPVGLRIVNGLNPDTDLIIPFPESGIGSIGSFRGFYDMLDAEGKELFLGNRTVLNTAAASMQLPEHFVPAAFVDVDGDALVDIIGRDTVADRVQIYGQSATTPVTEVFQQSLGLSVEPVFPNPASELIRLPISLSESMRVQITLYDAAGRQVRTVVDGILPKGEQLVQGAVQGLARGIYHLEVRTVRGMLTQKVVVR